MKYPISGLLSLVALIASIIFMIWRPEQPELYHFWMLTSLIVSGQRAIHKQLDRIQKGTIDLTPHHELLATIKDEYDRCIHLMQHPEESAELYGVHTAAEVATYYSFRAEGLGFVLDRAKV